MELQYFGANCVRISTKKANIIIDDNLESLGLKPQTKPGDIAIFTGPHAGTDDTDVKLIIDQPGEYEVSDTSVQGVAARAHMDEEGAKTATMFKIIGDDIRLVALGHVHPDLSDEQLEALGTVDVLVIPVGGNGYTLDGIGALKVIKKIEPKLIVPTHYDDSAVKYPVPQQPLEEVLKVLSMEPSEPVAKLKVKAGDLESSQIAILERQ